MDLKLNFSKFRIPFSSQATIRLLDDETIMRHILKDFHKKIRVYMFNDILNVFAKG